MASEEYRLHYGQHPDVVFPSQSGMKRYLENEQQLWAPFLAYLRDNTTIAIRLDHGRHHHLAAPLNIVKAITNKLGDPATFNEMTHPRRGNPVIPPPSDSLEGLLILGLFENQMAEKALAAYVYFIVTNAGHHYQKHSELDQLAAEGKLLIDAAPVFKALPFKNIANAEMAKAVRTAEIHVQSLAEEVAAAQEANAMQAAALDAQLKEQKAQAKRLNDLVLKLNRRREHKHKLWVQTVDQIVEDKFEEAKRKVFAVELAGQRAEKTRNSEFEQLQDLFRTQLELRAPAEQWGKREKSHSKKARHAMWWFLGVGLCAVIFGLGVPWVLGEYIGQSFVQLHCKTPATETTAAADCERIFSAKGPATITGLLLVMSFLMWMARLQYRIHLSERHLALDASEKKAFAETYLAMKESRGVNANNEAIILASLFRPTQDGIIRDDEAGLDLSAASILARQLSRPS